MEQDDRKPMFKRPEELEELLGIEREEPDFEDFLRKRADDLCAPLTHQELTLDDLLKSLPDQPIKPLPSTPALDPEAVALDAAAILKSEPKSGMDEAAELDALFTSGGVGAVADALTKATEPDPLEKETKLVIKKHEIIGTYVSEVVEPAAGVDEEWKKVFIDTHKLAVTGMTPEQIIEHRNALDRAVFIIRAQQGGLKIALEELLSATTAGERARLLDLDRKYKAKARDYTKGRGEKKLSTHGSGIGKTGKGKTAKMIDALKGLMMSKQAIEDKLRGANMLDAATQDYIDKAFGVKGA